MHPLKTERGRTVLQTHGNALDLRQRRALILCDGKRSLAELGGMLGDDAAALIAQLQREGYVLAEDAAATSTAPAAPVAAAPVERRRSMVVARIYVLDILALQRNPTAAHLHKLLQAARAEADTVSALKLALSHLPAMTSDGYTQRVRGRLQEVLPEAHLAAVLAPLPA
ncbi:hypothetical protein [Stenotrophomonas sp. UBA7606]|uniref:hypothetical protein n=1 Tax=Stenotrophomonas sp. UBA7606 TaxID=1947559 RepID=UPI0025F15A66|nr:hypothetical protein [Stenotrophomonas sp. UBA7606]